MRIENPGATLNSHPAHAPGADARDGITPVGKTGVVVKGTDLKRIGRSRCETLDRCSWTGLGDQLLVHVPGTPLTVGAANVVGLIKTSAARISGSGCGAPYCWRLNGDVGCPLCAAK